MSNPPPSTAQQIGFWNSLEFHRSFLSDEIRNRAYREALAYYLKPGSTVLDLGSGTGILSFLAASAGAARVLGVDWSALVEPARKTAERLNLADQVQFLHQDLRTLKRSDHPFIMDPPDLIVHDLIGGLVWDEDMTAILAHILGTLTDARTIVLPTRYDVWLVPVTAPKRAELQAFWSSEQEGLDFSEFLALDVANNEPFIRHETAVHLRHEEPFLGDPQRLFAVECAQNADFPPLSALKFTAKKDGWLDAYLGFMVIDFGPGVAPINTRPGRPATNWGQFLIPSPNPRLIRDGEVVGIEMQPARWSSCWIVRELT